MHPASPIPFTVIKIGVVMLKVLGGDWEEKHAASIRKSFTGKFDTLVITRGFMKNDKFKKEDILSADIVTEENQKSIAGKLGWGAAGAIALGPLGLLAGVLGGGNKNVLVVAVAFQDGRKILLQGKSKELMPLVGAAF